MFEVTYIISSSIIPDVFSILGIGVVAFIASNIDDTFILVLLFTGLNFQTRHIITGQFLGMGVLIIISTLGALIVLVVPPLFVALLGLVPIAIGIKRLLDYENNSETATKNKKLQNSNTKSIIPFLTVSGITIANGGDDIGIFTPLFAKYNTVSEVSTLVTVFMIMTFVWCLLIYYFVNRPLVVNRIHCFGNKITPFVLIGLGVYILADALLV